MLKLFMGDSKFYSFFVGLFAVKIFDKKICVPKETFNLG